MKGIRVIDFTRVLAGPVATQMLADEGADVIKVEPPGGDETRGFEPKVDGVSTYFLAVNRGKRSIELDLGTLGGRAVARRLVSGADVVVENFRGGVAERVGLDALELCSLFPRLVVVSIRAFGEGLDPNWTSRPGYDMVLQALGGAMSFTGFPGSDPLRSGAPMQDLLTGLQTANAVALGLLHRERTGQGQHIVVNMMQVAASALVYHGSRWLLTGVAERPRGNAHAGLVPYDTYRCSDGWLVIACGNDRLFQALCVALGITPDAKWVANAGRVADRLGVDAAVAAAVRDLTVADADARLAIAGVPAARVADVGAALRHPVVETVSVTHPQLGEVPLPGPWIRTRDTQVEFRAPPELAVDRDGVLAEVGFTSAEVAQLSYDGAFGVCLR